jgi:MFS family permease
MHADASAILLTSVPAKRRYYGWRVLMVAAAAMVGTLPGRTQGLGLITESLLADFQMDRVTYAALNFWATIVGSAAAVGIGHLIDRFGSRVVLVFVAVSLGSVVCLMSLSSSFAGLAVGITLTRALGQSALSVVSLAIVGQWFVRRIDRAMATYSIVMSIGFMLAFPIVGSLVQHWGWREAWFAVGVTLVIVLASLGWAVVRRSPEAIGLRPDGEGAAGPPPAAPRSSSRSIEDLHGCTWAQALRTPAFWVFALGAALYGLVASGIGLFNESILLERGFGPQIYYQTLVVTALTALMGNFLGGWLAAYVPLGRLLGASLFILAGGLVALPYVATVGQVMVWAAAMGIGGGFVMVLFFSVWPRLFGRRHLGRIQGAAQALTVLASALGPLLLAWCVNWTGSYGAMFRILSGTIAIVAVAALAVTIRPLASGMPGTTS